MKGNKVRLELDETDSGELVDIIRSEFYDRLKPTNNTGKIPFTKIKVMGIDKGNQRIWNVTYGNIYNLSPTQVKERILKAIKQL